MSNSLPPLPHDKLENAQSITQEFAQELAQKFAQEVDKLQKLINVDQKQAPPVKVLTTSPQILIDIDTKKTSEPLNV